MLQNSINVHVTLNNGSINKYYKTRGECTVVFLCIIFYFGFLIFVVFLFIFVFFILSFFLLFIFLFFSHIFFIPPYFFGFCMFFFSFFFLRLVFCFVFLFFSNYDFFFNIKLVENLVMQFFSLKHYGLLQYFITWFFLWFFSFFFPNGLYRFYFFYIELIENFAS